MILVVEAKKQLRPPLTDQQRVFLAEDLYDLDEPIEVIRERGKSVVLKNTFQTIAFEHWVNELTVLKSDLMKIVDREIERRRAEFIFFRQNPPLDEELLASGLENVRAWEAAKRARLIEEKAAEIERLTARVRSYLRKVSDEEAQKWWLVLTNKRVVVEDNNWRLVLPFLASHLLEEIEPLIEKESNHALNKT